MNRLLQIALADFKERLGENRAEQVSFIIANDYRAITVFLFKEDALNPFGLLRVENYKDSVLKEYQLLHWFRTHSASPFREHIVFPVAHHLAKEMSIVSYPWIDRSKAHRGPADLRTHASDRLAGMRTFLQLLSGERIPAFLKEKTYDVEERIICLVNGFPSLFREGDEFFKKLRASVASLRGEKTFTDLAHGDLCPANVHFGGGRPLVFDWEAAHVGSVFLDWFFFVASYAMDLSKLNKKTLTPAPLEFAFFSANWFSDIVLRETRCLFAEQGYRDGLNEALFRTAMFDALYALLESDRSRIKRFVHLMNWHECVLTKPWGAV